MESNRIEIIEELIDVINKHKIKRKEILDIIIGFMYHMGEYLTGKNYSRAEDLLKDFAEKPTIGLALMNQAVYMKENWKGKD